MSTESIQEEIQPPEGDSNIVETPEDLKRLGYHSIPGGEWFVYSVESVRRHKEMSESDFKEFGRILLGILGVEVPDGNGQGAAHEAPG